tara:strand:- start:153 stop:404 length:252 start_codon:yes stop_codon:yes gene_type:complete
MVVNTEVVEGLQRGQRLVNCCHLKQWGDPICFSHEPHIPYEISQLGLIQAVRSERSRIDLSDRDDAPETLAVCPDSVLVLVLK